MPAITHTISPAIAAKIKIFEQLTASRMPLRPVHRRLTQFLSSPHVRNIDIPGQAAKSQTRHTMARPERVPSCVVPTVIRSMTVPEAATGRPAGAVATVAKLHRTDSQEFSARMPDMPLSELLRERTRCDGAAHSPAFSHPDASTERSRLLAHAQRMALEALRRPGFWNDGIIDVIVPNIVKCDAWPPGRALRIVDYDSDSIHFYSQQESRWAYAGKGNEHPLPEPSEGEILMIRQNGHFMRVDPDSEQLIHDVPRDGDCFFSCISTALGYADNVRQAFNLQLRDSVARYMESDPDLLEQWITPDPPSRSG